MVNEFKHEFFLLTLVIFLEITTRGVCPSLLPLLSPLPSILPHMTLSTRLLSVCPSLPASTLYGPRKVLPKTFPHLLFEVLPGCIPKTD